MQNNYKETQNYYKETQITTVTKQQQMDNNKQTKKRYKMATKKA